MTEIDKLIKTKQQCENIASQKGTGYEELKRRMNGICVSLSQDPDIYNPLKTINSISKYVAKQDRMLYSEISGFYYSLDMEKQGDFISNVEQLLIFCMENKEYSNICDYVLKIYDHAHLANYQIEKLQSKKDDDELKNIIAQNLQPVKMKLEDKMQSIQKEMYAQLIALVAIFTAMAFLVFGSISELDNIFGNLNNVSIYKIVIIGCVWSLCVMNMISIFMYFISRMTGLAFDKHCHYIIAWSNLIIIILLASAVWVYYIKSIGINEWYNILAKKHAVITSILGFGIILVLGAISVAVIIKRKDKK